jgi:hypothetical protein
MTFVKVGCLQKRLNGKSQKNQYSSAKKIVGWVKQSATQQSYANVGFRSSTQPTQLASNLEIAIALYLYLLPKQK